MKESLYRPMSMLVLGFAFFQVLFVLYWLLTTTYQLKKMGTSKNDGLRYATLACIVGASAAMVLILSVVVGQNGGDILFLIGFSFAVSVYFFAYMAMYRASKSVQEQWPNFKFGPVSLALTTALGFISVFVFQWKLNRVLV